MPPYSIFIIEDQLDLREAMTTALADNGHKSGAVEDGQSALRILEDLRTAAIFFVDLALPGEDGWHLISKIRSHGQAHGLFHRIVIISGLHNAHTIAHLESVGFLAKPFNLSHLLSVVNALTSQVEAPAA